MEGGTFSAARVDAGSESGPGPGRVVRTFGKAITAGDAAAAAACFSSQACLLTPDGTEVIGREGIREVLSQLATTDSEIAFEQPRILTVGTAALCFQRWSMWLAGGAADRYERVAVSTSLLRHHGAKWELLVSAPWSGDGAAGTGVPFRDSSDPT